VIDLYEQNRATAKALRDIIRSKQRFPKEEFAALGPLFHPADCYWCRMRHTVGTLSLKQ
jgi:hypothetical protein